MHKIVLSFIIACFLMNLSVAQNTEEKKKADPCDTTLKNNIYTACEIMPAYDLNKTELEKEINASLGHSAEQNKEDHKMLIGLIIDCKGNPYHYTAYNSPDTSLSNKIIKILKAGLTWTPGKAGGHNVLCYYFFHFEIVNGIVKLLR